MLRAARIAFLAPGLVLGLLVAGCAASTGSASDPGASAVPAPSTAPGPSTTPATPATTATPAPSATPASGAAPATSAPATPSTPAATGPTPVLGVRRGPTKGYGSARPATIDNGGDPTGIVTNVKWSTWGGPRATGTGLAYYDPPGQPVAKSVPERATVVAFNLGTCTGHPAYQAIEWYFPESGGSFSPGSYLNICSWTYSGSGS